MGLSAAEYEKIKRILGREPNQVETGMFAVMWSEHCGYKNSKSVLKLFPRRGACTVLEGPGENAGVVALGEGLAVAFKMESHNHPSAIEPFQGAATGVGGILRDIFTMGARPVALLNSLRFGELDDPRVRYLLGGVVSGISWYGNCTGVPTVGGEVAFDSCYKGNPLVNVMCVGILQEKDLVRGRAAPGHKVILAGARTGRDGIHGVTFASEILSEASASRRPSVQVGDPFLKKLLLEASLEVIKAGLVAGMQDLGGAGLTCALSETASRGGSGMEINLALVPRREKGMTPYEVMLSESQERMLLLPHPGREEEVQKIFSKWGLEATVIGETTADGILRLWEKGKVVAEVPAKALTEECPVYSPPQKFPAYLVALRQAPEVYPPEPADYGEAFLGLLSSPTIASKEWVYHQYDYQVQINTVVPPGKAGAAVLRLKGTSKGIAVTTDGNSRYGYLDPYVGGALAVCEAARNLVCVGARPLAVTDCLNFGNPEKEEVFWQFVQTVEGISAACKAFALPVVSGNVSFYNEIEGEPVYPTPVIGMVGLLEDARNYCTPGFKAEGDLVFLLGETKAEGGGSIYFKNRGLWGKKPPELNLKQEKKVQALCLKGIKEKKIKSAQDLAEGGLAVALAESCLLGGKGAKINLPPDLRADISLFSETQGRLLVSVAEQDAEWLEKEAKTIGLPCFNLGKAEGEVLTVSQGKRTLFTFGLKEMEAKWKGAIAGLMS